MKLTTLCYPIVNGKVLLAMKKRGVGVGKWNGPGGKLKANESSEDACLRETQEEVGVIPLFLEYRGVIEFIVPSDPEIDNRCKIFVATAIEGIPVETEEMWPRWFDRDNIPYDEMWDDDRIWLPSVLAGGSVSKRFTFDVNGKVVREEDL